MRLQEAAQAGAKLVILPEMWNCPYSNDCFPKYAEDIDAGRSASVSEMSASAKESGVTLVAGSIPEGSNGKVYNTCCIFDDRGKLLAKHRKASIIWPFRQLCHHAQPKEHVFVYFITLYHCEADAMANTSASHTAGGWLSKHYASSNAHQPSHMHMLISISCVSALDHTI